MANAFESNTCNWLHIQSGSSDSKSFDEFFFIASKDPAFEILMYEPDHLGKLPIDYAAESGNFIALDRLLANMELSVEEKEYYYRKFSETLACEDFLFALAEAQEGINFPNLERWKYYPDVLKYLYFDRGLTAIQAYATLALLEMIHSLIELGQGELEALCADWLPHMLEEFDARADKPAEVINLINNWIAFVSHKLFTNLCEYTGKIPLYEVCEAQRLDLLHVILEKCEPEEIEKELLSTFLHTGQTQFELICEYIDNLEILLLLYRQLDDQEVKKKGLEILSARDLLTPDFYFRLVHQNQSNQTYQAKVFFPETSNVLRGLKSHLPLPL